MGVVASLTLYILFVACPRCYPLRRLRRPPEPTLAGGPMTELATNLLYYGDNLDILRRYLPDADAA